MKNLSVCLRRKGKTSFLYAQEKMQLFLKYFLQVDFGHKKRGASQPPLITF